MPVSHRYSKATGSQALAGGFTLIELSIVLVIIGLIVGGVLAGQNLISAAAVRAQITQIERYNTAANTFRGKYGYLPGDIPPRAATQFGFVTRTGAAGAGDGNGVIEGYYFGTSTVYDWNVVDGETALFWVDLSAVGLIDGGFTAATGTSDPASSSVPAYLPPAKIGNGNYVYAYSNGNPSPGSINYYGLSSISQMAVGHIVSTPGLTVAQANAIDSKMDDGFPMLGNVIASYLPNGVQAEWAGTAIPAGSNYTIATTGSPSTCWDNGGSGGTQKYSVQIGNGANVNCALSFRFQ